MNPPPSQPGKIGQPSQTSLSSTANPSEKPKRRPIKLRWYFIGAAGIFLLLVVMVYVSAFWHEPDPSVDYLAMVNAKAEAVAEEERAWPLYRDALVEMDRTGFDSSIEYGPKRNPHYIPPTTQPADHVPATKPSEPASYSRFDDIWGSSSPSTDEAAIDTTSEFLEGENVEIRPPDPRWESIKEKMKAHSDILESIRKASERKHLGLILRWSYAGHDSYLSKHDMKYESGERIISNIYTAYFSQSRTLTRLLMLDYKIAILEKDWDRALRDLKAGFNIAGHVGGRTFILSQLVSVSIRSMVMYEVTLTLEQHASGIPVEILDEMAGLLDAAKPAFHSTLDDEYFAMLDILQNMYASNGSMTDEGLILAIKYELFPPQLRSLGINHRQQALIMMPPLLPWIIATTASHKQVIKELDAQIRKIETRQKLDPWEIIRTSTTIPATTGGIPMHPTYVATGLDDSYWPLELFTYPQQADMITLRYWYIHAQSDVLRLVIALEKFRREHNSYPESLALLVPEYMAEIPTDFTTGKPLLYQLTNGKPVIYCAGLDQDDDHAATSAQFGRQQNGDLILYPIPE